MLTERSFGLLVLMIGLMVASGVWLLTKLSGNPFFRYSIKVDFLTIGSFASFPGGSCRVPVWYISRTFAIFQLLGYRMARWPWRLCSVRSFSPTSRGAAPRIDLWIHVQRPVSRERLSPCKAAGSGYVWWGKISSSEQSQDILGLQTGCCWTCTFLCKNIAIWKNKVVFFSNFFRIFQGSPQIVEIVLFCNFFRILIIS